MPRKSDSRLRICPKQHKSMGPTTLRQWFRLLLWGYIHLVMVSLLVFCLLPLAGQHVVPNSSNHLKWLSSVTRSQSHKAPLGFGSARRFALWTSSRQICSNCLMLSCQLGPKSVTNTSSTLNPCHEDLRHYQRLKGDLPLLQFHI